MRIAILDRGSRDLVAEAVEQEQAAWVLRMARQESSVFRFI